jgi:hypothetical protein
MESLEDERRRQATILAARELGSLIPRAAARDVYRRLLAASVRGRRLKAVTEEEVVRDEGGAPLFRIKHQTNSIALVLHAETLTTHSLQRIRGAITCVLQGASEATS